MLSIGTWCGKQILWEDLGHLGEDHIGAFRVFWLQCLGDFLVGFHIGWQGSVKVTGGDWFSNPVRVYGAGYA